MIEKDRKKAMLKGIRDQMYQEYKTKSYANGKVPMSFEEWSKEYVENTQKTISKDLSTKEINVSAEPLKTKECAYCEEEKELTEFNKHPNTKDGLQIYCKSCYKDIMKARREQKKQEEDQSKEVEIKQPISEPKITEQIVFTLTKEELIEFGKECFAKGRSAASKLDDQVRSELISEIVNVA